MTNMTCACLRQAEQQLKDLNREASIDGIYSRLSSSFDTSPDGNSGMDGCRAILDELRKPWQILMHFKQGHNLSAIASCASCVQKPADYVQSPDGAADAPNNLHAAILDNVFHLILRKDAPSTIVRQGTPAYADIGYLMGHSENETNGLRSTFALDLLSCSYQSYLMALPCPASVSKCRLSALRLAQQAVSSIESLLVDKACFPCKCPQTLAFHLDNLKSDLQAFAKHRCWDLYFQSPWVAGNHILEILDMCHYYGMRLFNYRHFVGAVLHSYNVLEQLAGLEKIPLLEGLCNSFKDTFFSSGRRPTHNFRACWARYVGARLKFKKGHKGRNHRDSWCMAVPAHAAKAAAGLGVGRDSYTDVDLSKDSLVFGLKQQDYHLSNPLWNRLRKEHDLPASVLNDASGGALANSLSHLVPIIDGQITASKENPFPPARLNLFSIFASCNEIVSTLSDAGHTDPQEKSMHCICFASSLLQGADRIMDARRLGKIEPWKKHEREMVELAKQTLLKVVGEIEKDDGKTWLWAF